MVENKIDELIELSQKHTHFQTGDTMEDIQKVFMGWNLWHIKNRLNPEEYQYFVANSFKLMGIETKFNLSIVKLTQYIKRYFFKFQPNLSEVVLNKKVIINEEKCIEKIKEIEYAYNSFSIKIGAITLQCFTNDFENFRVTKYDGTLKSTSESQYVLLYNLYIPGLNLKALP